MSDDEILHETLEQRLSRMVRTLRIERGLTLNVASERAEMHWRLWQKIEAAAIPVTVRMLVRVSIALGVDGADLLATA